MLDSRQYADRSLQPLRARTEDLLADGGRMVRLLDPALAQPMLWQTLPLPVEGWNLHLLHDAGAASGAGRDAALAGGAAWLALGFLTLFVQQRRRLASIACAAAASWKPCSSNMHRNCAPRRTACCRRPPRPTAASAAASNTCRRAWW